MIAARYSWRLAFMSGDSDIPNRFGPAARWVLVVIALFVFFLLGAEEFKDGKPVSGGIFTALFIATFIVAVKWVQIAAFLGRDKVTLALIGVGLLCALGLGVVVGVLLMRSGDGRSQTASTGRITWNFDQIEEGKANFLNLIRLNQDEIRVVGVGVHGKNISNDPVSEFRGYVRSDLTNARLPFFIMAEEPSAASATPNPFHPAQIPTRPEETFGIPALADFDVVTYEEAIITHGVSGIPVSQFIREFGNFTIILEYDGIRVEHKFTTAQINAAVKKLEETANPQRTTAPRVTRRPNASAPVQLALPVPLPVIPVPAPALSPPKTDNSAK
jgi:hypothetical protein